MSKHTPEPWEVDPRGGYFILVVNLPPGRKEKTLASVAVYDHETAMADLKLMAAAPDLAMACAEFLRQLGTGAIQVFDTDDDPTAIEGSNDICQMIEAAVIKAGIEVDYE